MQMLRLGYDVRGFGVRQVRSVSWPGVGSRGGFLPWAFHHRTVHGVEAVSPFCWRHPRPRSGPDDELEFEGLQKCFQCGRQMNSRFANLMPLAIMYWPWSCGA